MSHFQDDDLFAQVQPLFNAMGDSTRQTIILALARHTRLSVGELTTHTHLSRPAVSHHIKILREAGLVVEQREGTRRYYRPTFLRYLEPMRRIIALVEENEVQE
jgi:DNA-binding transcriptional ArsR family regulator